MTYSSPFNYCPFESIDNEIKKCPEDKTGTVIIPSGTVSIGQSSFALCKGVSEVIIPNTVQIIKDYAFAGCTDMKSISIPESVIEICRYAFRMCDDKLFNIYEGVRYLGDEENPYRFLIEPISNDITECVVHPQCRMITDIAFEYCAGLEAISLSENLTRIGREAFDGCRKLRSIEIPSSVIEIGKYAFSNCTELSRVLIKNPMVSLGHKLFYQCTALNSMTVMERFGDKNVEREIPI